MNIQRIKNLKGRRKIAVLTAYDAQTAAVAAEAGADILLVGDSVATVLLGYASTGEISMDEMLHHARAVRRGAPSAFVVGDVPLKALKNKAAFTQCRRFLLEAGCDAVKLEWNEDAAALTSKLVRGGVPVMGHVGLTPQTAGKIGGLKVQGKTSGRALEILNAARAFEKAGVFSVVIECVPRELGSAITKTLSIPTIGIGAGPDCDGQVLVFHDVVGLTPGFGARFVKRYARLYEAEKKAVQSFVRDVRARKFPEGRHAFTMDPAELKEFRCMLLGRKVLR